MAIMNEKPVARGMDIPPGRTVPAPEEEILFTESVPVEPEVDDKLKQPTTEEEKVIDMALGAIKDFIWDEGYDEIVSRLEQSQGSLQQAIGEMAGRMVNREVMASDEGGNPISRDLLYSLGAEVVNELYNVAEREGIYDKGDERQDQELQGESLIYAAEKYVDMGDEKIDPSGSMKLAANAMRGGYPEEETITKMGIPIEEETIDVEAV